MDYEGAAAAYRKSIQLDPKDKETRANLALLLEYDPDGVRYGEKAKLLDAVQVLRELKKVDEDFAKKYDDNILYDLWYAGDYKGVLTAAGALPASDVRTGLIIGAIAALNGADAALKKSTELTANDADRSKALMTSGAVLVRVRKYPEASAIYAEAARGQSNAGQVTRTAQIFAKTKPYEESNGDLEDPVGLVKRITYAMTSADLTLTEFESMTYRDPQYSEQTTDPKRFANSMSQTRVELLSTGLPLKTVADITIANTIFTTEGDDATGFKVTSDSVGVGPRFAYVLKTPAGYRMVGYSSKGSADVQDLAPAALRALDNGNLAAARKWLDWARDELQMNSGDDPLSGSTYPHFWTKGQDGDAETARTAALVLLRSKMLTGQGLETLKQARTNAKSDAMRDQLTMVLAYAYQAQDRWAEMAAVSEELVKAQPSSLRAYGLLAAAYLRTGRFDDWEKLAAAREKAYPDEMAYVRSEIALTAQRGDFAGARAKMKTLMDKGKATASDLNLYAWYALFLPGTIDAESLDAAQRANDSTSHSDYSILHSLGCLYAEMGKTAEARETFLKAMEVQHLESPDSSLWAGFGLIAEQYGVADAATRMYGRVEKLKYEQPDSTYNLAQKHLLALQGGTAGARTAPAPK